MGVIKEVKIKITGQVPDDIKDNYYEVMLAKLKVVCAEYKLELEEN